MRKIAHITGSSSGIGKAISEALLQDGWTVYGYARRETIDHGNYHHLKLDLRDVEEAAKIDFTIGAKDAGKIILLNNAGQAEPVKRLGELPKDDLTNGICLNYITPVLLMNSFIGGLKNSKAEKVIINVSTGAAKYPVKGWTMYCSTKAALDMVTRVAAEENTDKQCKIFAVAPGIVDTEMQDMIRESDPQHFPRLQEFRSYKEQKKLKDPFEVAKMYVQILNNPDHFSEVIFAV